MQGAEFSLLFSRTAHDTPPNYRVIAAMFRRSAYFALFSADNYEL